MRSRYILLLSALLALSLYAVVFAQESSPSDGTIPTPGPIYLPLVSKFVPTVTPTNTPLPTATNTALATATKTPVPPTATKTPVPPTATKTPVPPTSTPFVGGVSIKSHRGISVSDSLYVVGEVQNTTDNSVYFAQIQAKFYDNAHQLVAVEDGYTYLTRTGPGQLNPFKVILSNAPTTIATYELSLTSRNSTSLDYRSITVLSQQTRNNFGTEVFGEVRNDAEDVVRSPQVVVTFYDANGSVLDTDYSYASGGDLAKGQTDIYSISTFSDDPFSSYTVQAESYLVP